MIQETSISAYLDILEDLSERQQTVFRAILKLQPCSNTMIARYLRVPINTVTGRVNELRNDKKLVGFAFKNLCPLTGKKVMFWKALEQLNNRR